MFLFCRKFKKNIKNKLMRDGVEIINFEILIEKAIAIDNKLYFRVIKKNLEKNIRGRAEYALNFGFYKNILFYPQGDFIEFDNF